MKVQTQRRISRKPLAWASFALACLLALPAAAWPDRQVVLAVPLGAGTSPDLVARVLAEALQRQTGRPFVVENRVGATGAIGTRAVIGAAPDGHTLLVTSSTLLLTPLLLPASGYEPLTQLRPIRLLGSNPLVLVANPAAEARTLPALLALARARPPGAIDYGSPGGSLYLTMALMATQAGVEMNHISFRTGGDLMNALVAATVNYAWVTQAMAQPLVQAGRLNALAQSGAVRASDLPQVPTAAEAGLPGLVVDSWVAVFAPRALPDALAEQIDAAFGRALAEPATEARMRSQSIGAPRPQRPLAEQLRMEQAVWRDLVVSRGLAAQ